MPAGATLVAGLLLLQVDSPETTRRHDLTALLAVCGTSVVHFDLFPHVVSYANEPVGSSDPDRVVDADELCEALVQLAGSDAERPIPFKIHGATLLVQGPAEVHERLDRLLAQVTAALLGHESLEVRVIAGIAPPTGPLLVDAAEAERRTQELVASGRGSVRRSGSVGLTDGVATAIHAVTTAAYVRDWEVELCHGSAIHVPVTDEVTTGLTASVRAARLPGATWLDLALRYSEPAAPMRDRVVEPKVWFASPAPHEHQHVEGEETEHDLEAEEAREASLTAAMFHGTVPLRLQSPVTRFLSCAGSFVIPDGKALWIPCQVATQAGAIDGLLDVRVSGPVRPALQALEGGEAAGVVSLLVHAGALRSRGFEITPVGPESFTPDVVFEDAAKAWWPSRVSADFRFRNWQHSARLQAAIAAATDVDGVLHDSETVPISACHLLVASPPAVRERLSAELGRLLAANESIEIAGRVLDGATTVASFRLPATFGCPVTLWSGVAGSYLVDWDVDLANQAIISNPEIAWFLDGFALGFVVRPIGGTRLQLSVNGMVNLLDGPPTSTDLVNPYTPSYEKVRARRLFIDETRAVTAGRPDAPLRFAGSPLALEITVRRP